MATKLIFPVGIPGSGKSTWARTILDRKYSIVSSDEIRKQKWGSLRAAHDVTPEVKKERNEEVWDEFYAKLGLQLEHCVDSYADGTNLTSRARSRLRHTASLAGADLHVIVFDNTIEALERNVQREPDLIVPDDVQTNFLKLFAESWEDILGKEKDWYETITIIGSLQ